MSYYDPLYPAYEATRYQIQKTILGLQQKLRRRKELDINLQRDIIQSQAAKIQRNIINQSYLNKQTRAQEQLRQSLRRLRMYDPMSSTIPFYKQDLFISKHAEELDYFERLNQLRKQRQLLQQERFLYKQVQKRSPEKYKRQQDSDDILVKKYQDGSKINQYNNQLQRSNEKRQNKHIDSVRRNNQNRFNQIHPQKINNNFQTPFDKLNENQTIDRNNYHKNQKNPSYSNNKKRLYEDQQRNKPNLKYAQTKKQSVQATQPTQQLIKMDNKEFQRLSPSKSIRRSPIRAISRSKSINRLNKSLNKSGIKLDRSRAETLQQSALKKIQNRLILSSVIYQDSLYRNNKHQINHLQNTYQNQLKIRKDIKDKINCHPIILRKHAMVVQN